MRLDHITADDALNIKGSSAANANNALRTLRRMLRKAHEWQLLSVVPVVKLVEEYGREQLIEPWMEQQLPTVTRGPRLTEKGPNIACRLGALSHGAADHAGFRSSSGEIFQMRWENIHWDKG